MAAIPNFSTKFRLYRFNIGTAGEGADRLNYSFIYRTVDFRRKPDALGEDEFRYASQASTHALYWNHALDEELSLVGMISLEDYAIRGGEAQLGSPERFFYPEVGFSIELKL